MIRNEYHCIFGQYWLDIFPTILNIYLRPSPSITGATMSIPMTQSPTLIEPSFVDGIAILAATSELPEQTRRHWVTSLRQIAKALGKPPELIPARYSAVRADLGQLHPARLGVTPKTLQNHKSNAKAALLWLGARRVSPNTAHR